MFQGFFLRVIDAQRTKCLTCNLLQHNKRLKDPKLGCIVVEGGDEDGDPKNIAINLLTVADSGNAAFLDELLQARLDPDIGDSKGRTPLVSFLYIYLSNQLVPPHIECS